VTGGAFAVVQPAAIRHNLQRIRSAAPGCRVMAVIKANGYGHGLISVAQILDDVDALAVARVSEGLQLREAGITNRIVILEGCADVAEAQQAALHNLDIVVHDPVHFKMLTAIDQSDVLTVWLKLDTGMGRLGFAPADMQTCMEHLSRIPAVKAQVDVMTHLACADDPDNPTTLEQIRRFGETIGGSYPGEISIANSAGVLVWPQTLEPSPLLSYTGSNWVRPGLALFGASPVLGKSAREMGLLPAMSFESRLIAVKTVRRGTSVGYGGDWRAKRDTVIGVIAAGYGDGYPRHLQAGTPVLVNGRRVALIGRVSMDMINVDLTDVAVAKVGDPAVLWGGHLPVEEIAARADTISYELMCGLSQRVEYRLAETETAGAEKQPAVDAP